MSASFATQVHLLAVFLASWSSAGLAGSQEPAPPPNASARADFKKASGTFCPAPYGTVNETLATT